MKNEFIGFYDPTEKEIKEAWDNAIFIFDTNCLLNLYRFTYDVKNEFIEILKLIGDRLYLPYQIAYEFHRNRFSVINDLEGDYIKFKKEVTDIFEKQITSKLNEHKRHPSIKIEEFSKLNNDYLNKFNDILNKQKETHTNYKANDQILDFLTDLYDNKVGESYAQDYLQELYIEGEKRYTSYIPPGYMDKDSKKNNNNTNEKNHLRRIYGDLIIWKDILNCSKEKDKLIIFVTDDGKEDWWTKEGKTIRAREELIKEFYDFTGKRILIYSSEEFLNNAKIRNIYPNISENIINEVKELRINEDDVLKENIRYLFDNNFHNTFNNGNIISLLPKPAMNDYFNNLNELTVRIESIYNAPLENLKNAIQQQELTILNNIKKTLETQNQSPLGQYLLNYLFHDNKQDSLND